MRIVAIATEGRTKRPLLEPQGCILGRIVVPFNPNDGYACANLTRLAASTSVGQQKLVAFVQSRQSIDNGYNEGICCGGRDSPRPHFSHRRCAHCFWTRPMPMNATWCPMLSTIRGAGAGKQATSWAPPTRGAEAPRSRPHLVLPWGAGGALGVKPSLTVFNSGDRGLPLRSPYSFEVCTRSSRATIPHFRPRALVVDATHQLLFERHR